MICLYSLGNIKPSNQDIDEETRFAITVYTNIESDRRHIKEGKLLKPYQRIHKGININ